MCQNKNNSNINVYPFAIVDRDQKIIPTYLRTKKARKTSNTSPTSYDSRSLSSGDKIISSHCQNCTQANCDSMWEKNERHSVCDKELSTLNMDQSSCFLTNSLNQLDENEEDSNGSTRFYSNDQPNVHLENTQFANMIKGQQQQEKDSHDKDHTTHRHRTTAKKVGSTKTSDCFLAVLCLLILGIDQVLAKPIDNRFDSSNMASDAHSLKDKLRSPCREEQIPTQEDHNQANIKGILQVITRQSGIAKTFARQDVARYLRITEGVSVDEFHSLWSGMEQGWLYPEEHDKFPKGFGESVPMSVQKHFREPASKFNDKNMKKKFIERLIKLLQECDERFQLLLIGFHNILDDHNNKRSTMDLEKFNPLLKIFSRAKDNTQMVLCEIRTALHKLGANVKVLDPQSVRSAKSPSSNFYDWVIFREYINQLEHINEIANIIIENID